MPTKPLRERPGYEESREHPLVKELQQLVRRHGLVGAVLVTFDAEKIFATASGVTPEFGAHMHRLADQILVALDDGLFDPPDGSKPN